MINLISNYFHNLFVNRRFSKLLKRFGDRKNYIPPDLIDAIIENKNSSIRKVYFHEDSYLENEIVPASQFDRVSVLEMDTDDYQRRYGNNESAWIKDFPNGLHEETLLIYGLSMGSFDKKLSEIAPMYNIVETGYSSHREVCINTKAWGFNDGETIFVQWNHDGIIDRIWISNHSKDPNAVENLFSLISVINETASVLYVEWGKEFFCKGSDKNAFYNHFFTKSN